MGEKKGLKAHRQIAIAKVGSPEAAVYSCSRLNCSKCGTWNASVILPYKTIAKLILPAVIAPTIRPIKDRRRVSRRRRMKMTIRMRKKRKEKWEVKWMRRLGMAKDPWHWDPGSVNWLPLTQPH